MLSSLSLLASAFLSLTHAKCFHMNGSETLDPGHQRCSLDPLSPIYNVCCAVSRTNPPGANLSLGWASDICLPNGICQNKFFNESGPFTKYFREECTESDWSTGNCPNFCVQGVCYVQWRGGFGAY
ncbi:hypothetical protein CC80DRAFT_428335 [Byssothecium circinans]|uniref:Uncharacterized protein n=1 Tax=Byssothecium circinans TaxID=147558 RepID=A0A6A5TLF5_9PLEO|nr:hypothetical protein CC80DRAFT_428335 [Byssothecium circinans]